MKQRNLSYTIFIMIIFFLGSTFFMDCGKRTITLDRRTKNMIDTMAARQINVLRVELDSACDARFDSFVSVAVDSILKRRQAEIDIILKQ